jgi:ankyrin repeat protein
MAHTKNSFTYALFAAIAMGDPIAVGVILSTGFDVNTLDSTRSNALNAAVNRGAYDMVILLLNRNNPARIEHSIVNARTHDWTIVFNALDTAVVKANATMIALLLLLAKNQLDVVMLERAQEIAEQNDLTVIASMLDEAMEDNLTHAYEQLAQLPRELLEKLPAQMQEAVENTQRNILEK